MKKLFTFAMMFLFAAVFAADPAALLKEAQTAFKAKDYAAAITKYTEAENAATNSLQKRTAILGKFNCYIKQGKHPAARQYMEEAVEDEMLKPIDARFLLNNLVVPYLWWPSEFKYALNILNLAQSIEIPKISNHYFQTYHYMACIYRQQKQYEAIIDMMRQIVNINGQHPANKYVSCCFIGAAYEKLGKKEDAVKSYQEALAWAKKVTYKMSADEAEKALKRLSK